MTIGCPPLSGTPITGAFQPNCTCAMGELLLLLQVSHSHDRGSSIAHDRRWSGDAPYAVVGFGEASPPRVFLFPRLLAALPPTSAGKEGFLEGLRPSKPPSGEVAA